MIRKGKHTVYQGREFKFVEAGEKKLRLISNDPDDVKYGFTPHQLNPSVLTKTVLTSEAEKKFYVTPYAIYKGKEFPVSDSNGKALLDTSNTELAKTFHFERTDKYLYSKFVDWNEITVIEKIEPLE